MTVTNPSEALPLALQATTGPAGYALINGTGTVLSWTAPNDGQLHRVQVAACKVVSVAETGGAIALTINGRVATLIGGTNGTLGYTFPGTTPIVIVPAGATVVISQSSALTAGASTLFAELWAS